VTSTGRGREAVWRAIQANQTGVRRLTGVTGIPDGMLLGAPVDIEGEFPGQLKNIPLCRVTAAEALADSGLLAISDFGFRISDWRKTGESPQSAIPGTPWVPQSAIRHPPISDGIDIQRFGCSIGAHMGDTDFVVEQIGMAGELIPPGKRPWWTQWFPSTACATVARDYDLRGPRLSNSTACASGTIAILKAVRSIRDGQCDIALAGSSEAIHPLFAAGFRNMGVLADHVDPKEACRPFDTHRNGFVMGEGAAMFVLERLEHARERGAQIYAEILGGRILTDAHHVTSLEQSDTLSELIRGSLRKARLVPRDIAYINAHGTGTRQNDVIETRGIRAAFGRAADNVCVSATKSMLGHLVNASGSVELAITALALRDGFAPPTLNLTQPDPECDLDCIPLVGRARPLEHALKLSIAFGGHLAAVVLRRWTGREARQGLPLLRRAA
jgi:3-oxoacyl-(acyl-carrier-protein) synthase